MKRLDAIINVLLETAKTPDGRELKVIDKVRMLSDAGLRPVEIARIMNLSVNQVGVTLNDLKKKKKTKPAR